ncbi:CDP-glycerol glycerophosphotransferase family protein, partial [Streptomyces sp. NPDC005921]
MAIVVTFDLENTPAAQELYDTTIDRVTEGRGFASPADLPVPGLLAHIAGPVGDRWRVTDVWEVASDALITDYSSIMFD